RVSCGYCPDRNLLSFPTRRSSDLDLLVSGTVYGIAGRSVEGLGSDAAKAGRAGEESTGRVLDRIVSESQRDVWHDLDVPARGIRSEEHTSELQSRFDIVCRPLHTK